jgi:putative transposase
MIAFIDDHRTAHGVEPICKVLPIAPSTYHDHAAKRANPALLSARAQRDMALRLEIERVFTDNFAVYGARKVWRQLQLDGQPVARCTVERLMKDIGLQGVSAHERSSPFAAVSAPRATCSPDRTARAPRQICPARKR